MMLTLGIAQTSLALPSMSRLDQRSRTFSSVLRAYQRAKMAKRCIFARISLLLLQKHAVIQKLFVPLSPKSIIGDRIMAIPVTNIPVLTGEVAERFIEQCEYNAKHLAGSEWSQEKEDWFNGIMERSLEFQRKLGVR